MIVSIVCLALAGCGPNAAGSNTSASAEDVTAGVLPSRVPEGTKLVYADQAEQAQHLMAASGKQERLAADVSYANFQGGPSILEAIRSGSVDIAGVGDTPPIQAQAAGDTVLIVAARHSSAPDYQLAVSPGQRINTLAELRGKKIAYAEGTARQPFILRALDSAGLTVDDVTLVPLPAGDIPDAVTTGAVDVGPINEPTVSHYLQTPGSSVVPAGELTGLSNGLYYLYASAAALQDEGKAAAIRDFAHQWVLAQQWSQQNRDAWIKAYYVDGIGLTAEDGRRVMDAMGEVTFPKLDEALFARQQQTVDVLANADALPEKLDASKEFDQRFEPVIAGAAAEAGAGRGLR